MRPRTVHGSWPAGTAVVMAAGVLLAGTPPEKGRPVEETLDRGAIRVTSRVEDGRPSVADLIRLTVTVEAVRGVEVLLPEKTHVRQLEEKEYIVRSTSGQGPIGVADDRLRWTRTYEVETFTSGEHTLPGLEVRYKDRRQEAPGTPASTQPEQDWPMLESPCLKVEVTPVADQDADPSRMADIAGPVGLPSARSGAWLWWVAGLALAVLAGIAAWRRSRRRGRAAAARPPAHVLALESLRRLAEMRLVEQGRIQEFYFLISGVLRQYIEDRFGLRAPERTTTEFLAELADAEALEPAHKELLGRFLQHCDMVKFARHRPADTEIQSAFNLVRHFITATQTETPAVEPVRTTPATAAVGTIR